MGKAPADKKGLNYIIQLYTGHNNVTSRSNREAIAKKEKKLIMMMKSGARPLHKQG
jgi:hypothetical protein